MLGKALQQLLRLLRYAHLTLRGIMIGLFVVIASNAFLLTVYTVDGHSMDPTLHTGQVLLINRLAYMRSSPQVGDIVVVSFGNQGEITFVKRVEGIAGQLVAGRLAPLGQNQLFIEGDNRSFSTDSRSYGPITERQVLGKVLWQAP